MQETEKANAGNSWCNLAMSVLFPVPDGALITKGTPVLLIFMAILIGIKALGDSFCLDGGKDTMVGIGDNNGSGLAALGGVDEPSVLAGILAESAHGGRGRIDDGYDPGNDHKISKPDI